MPFNRVKDVKAMVLWLLIINNKEKQRKQSDLPKDEKLKALVEGPEIIHYYPGWMLIPIPEAGWCLGHVDVSFWACFLYVAGSVFYFIDTFYIWWAINPDYTDDAANPANYLNTIAAIIFVLNAFACIIDWWLQLKQMGAMNLIVDEDNQGGGLLLSEIPHKLSAYYFYNNIFFMGAAVIYLIQAIWWEDSTTDLQNCYASFCGEFWINFWGSLLYLGSSWFSVLEYWEYAKLRSSSNTPQAVLFTCNWRRLDWFGWGDWLFLATSIVAVVQVCINVFIDGSNDMYGALYMLENVLFLVDSLAYFIGYILYMYELQAALQSGVIDAKHTGSLCLLMDHMENEEFDQRSSIKYGSISSILSGGGRGSLSERHSMGGKDGVHATAPRSKTSFSITQDGKVSLDDIRAKFNEQQHRTQERISFSAPPNVNNSNLSNIPTNRVSFGGSRSSFGTPNVSGKGVGVDIIREADYTVNKLYVQQEEGDNESVNTL